MEDNTQYYKDPPRLIYELLQDTFGSDRFEYFLGSPIMLAQGAYPCIVVQSITSSNTVQDAPTGHDNVAHLINIHILYLDQLAAASSGTTDTTMRTLFQTVEGRDPATGFYMTGTVMYALRTNLDLGTTIIDHDIEVNYDVSRDNDKAIAECVISVAARERVSVPSRLP